MASLEATPLKGLVNLIECPVCYDLPKPTDKTVGTCYFGHIVCKSCYQSMVEAENCSCPQCRRLMYMSESNYLVNGILAIIEQGQLYECSYDRCSFTNNAREMVMHEKICSWRPLQCVNKGCSIITPFLDLAQNVHPCLTLLRKSDKSSPGYDMTWEFTLPIKDIFDMEQNSLCLSKRLLPKWLALPFNLQWRVYMYPIIRRQHIFFAIGWMSRKDAAPIVASKIVYKLTITFDGKWGQVTEDSLYFTDSIDPYKYKTDFDIDPQEETTLWSKFGPNNPIKIFSQDLLDWLGQCKQGTCSTCQEDLTKTGPHFHICIDVKNSDAI